ncbi:MAG: acetyl-CoA carboxylase biotin carboxyl carrier protein subunit [Deltaproteobacteria bacterium]|nr:MAG: acetyl-CoA carboxylase biotin carboxyl carrier protein subunit [Deltaproteobacteria bacterium]
MKYEAMIEGRSVMIEEVSPTVYKINGVEKAVDVLVLGPGLYSLLVDGQSHEVAVREDKKGKIVEVDAHLIPVKLLDPWAPKAAAGKDGIEGEVTLTSPMPGRVVSIKAEAGAAVEEGAGVIVVEAMKMENELQSPKTGKIKAVLVKVGDTVESGQDLVVIE